VGSTRYSLRQQHFFFLYDDIPKLFNTLIDRQESAPLSTRDPLTHTWFQKFADYFTQKKIPSFSGMPQVSVEKIRLAKAFVSEGPNLDTDRQMENFVKERPWEKQVLGWLARSYFRNQKWEKLESLGIEYLNPVWTYIARVKRGVSAEPPVHECFSLLFDKSERTSSSCTDQLFLNFLRWTRADNKNKPEAEDKFFRRWTLQRIDEQISRLNYQNGLMWDTALDLPGDPSLVELALSLPNYQKYLAMIEAVRKKSEFNEW
jgi:hypothetical protein